RRSGARLLLGEPVDQIRRDGARWIVNDRVSAPMLVGAGGHFCPVARLLNPASGHVAPDMPLIAAQEVELPIDPSDAASCRVAPERPELYFCRDLSGYGWCFRKEGYLNVGLGRLDRRALPSASAAFVDFLKARRAIAADAS